MKNRKIPIDIISDFLVLSESINISKSAKQLNTSQPALTRRLKMLEESLGTQLFVHQRRGLARTSSGRALRQEVTPAMDQLEGAIDRIQDLQKELSGVLVRGCFSEFGNYVLSTELYRLVKKQPLVKLDLRNLSEQKIIAGGTEGTLHMGVTNRVPKNEGVRAYKLTSEEICMVTSRSNPDLDQNKNPLFTEYRSTERLLNQYLKSQMNWKSGVHPDVHVSSNSHSAMICA